MKEKEKLGNNDEMVYDIMRFWILNHLVKLQ